MGLFDQILGAVGNADQLGNLAKMGSMLAGSGADPSAIQSAMSVVGTQVRSTLQEKQASEGLGAVQGLVNQFAGNSPNPAAVDALLSPDMQQQVTETISQRTGLDLGNIQQMLPMAVPMVLNLLKSGGSQGEGNPMLNAFLDADGDGDVDIADLMQMAGKYMR